MKIVNASKFSKNMINNWKLHQLELRKKQIVYFSIKALNHIHSEGTNGISATHLLPNNKLANNLQLKTHF